MTLQFAKYTEVTEYAFKVNPEYKKQGYIRIFVCPDVNDFWLARIVEGINEDYEPENGSFVLERNNIPKGSKSEELTINKVRKMLQDDNLDNWDMEQSYSIDKLIGILDGGFGILDLLTTTTTKTK